MKLIGHGYTAMCLFVTDLALALCAVEMAGLTKPGFLLWTLHIRVFRGN